jgi:hypothetical protein
MNKTLVTIVADLSGSMAGNKERKLREMVSALIKQLANEETKGNQLFEVSLLPFSNTSQLRGPWPASAAGKHVEGLTCSFPFGNGTALRDAIGKALEACDTKTPSLICVFSDGEEGHSIYYGEAKLRALLDSKEASGNLTLTFAGPQSARSWLTRIGLSEGNFQAWDGSEREMAQTQAVTSQSMDSYIQDRSKGVTRSARFYADPSALTASGVRGMTKKVTPSDVRKVTNKMDGRAVADFYGGKFKPGCHYYELIKPEYIQDGKDLVILMKDSSEYRQGSRTVRAMLSLPETGKIRVHPVPPDGKYTIFVQTNSMNRKVVEGQTFLTVE